VAAVILLIKEPSRKFVCK